MKDDGCDNGRWCNDKYKFCMDVPKPIDDSHNDAVDTTTTTTVVRSAYPCLPGSLWFEDRCVAFGNPSTPRAQDAPCRFDNGIHFDCQEGLKCSPTTDTCQPFEGN
ncbi:hypothetical protein RI367_004009 [Sorochytrium milnesiophthora]